MAIVEPAILRTCIRFRNGLASNICRLHNTSVWEPVKSHGDDSGYDWPCVPRGANTDFVPLIFAPFDSRKLATAPQDRGICNLAVGHVYLSSWRSRRSGSFSHRRTERLRRCLAATNRRLDSGTISPSEPNRTTKARLPLLRRSHRNRIASCEEGRALRPAWTSHLPPQCPQHYHLRGAAKDLWVRRHRRD